MSKDTNHPDLSPEELALGIAGQTARILLSSNPKSLTARLDAALLHVGKAVHGSYIQLWKNMEQDDRHYCTPITGPVMLDASQKQTPLPSSMPEYSSIAPGLWECLSRGECYTHVVRKLPQEKRGIFTERGILSVCVAPIFFGSDFWGILAVYDRSRERSYAEREEQILRYSGLPAAHAYRQWQETEKITAERDAAMDNAREKNIFLSNLSRQIRVPLNTIIAMSSIASESQGDGTRLQHCLSKIGDASAHLLRIMEDLTDISRMDHSCFVFDSAPFSLRAMLDSVIEDQNIASEKSRFVSRIENNVPDILLGDEMRIEQVVCNLLSDLVKYAVPGSEITITITEVSRDATESILDFTLATDENISNPSGIDDIMKAIPTASNSPVYRDISLGLSLANLIVEQMGGEILFSAAPGQGAQYSFSLRFIRRNKLSEALGLGTGKIDFSDKCILVAEDIEINQIIIRSLLEKTGVSIDIAETGAAALTLFSKEPQRYDLILMDISMPVMDGLEATRQIRALESGRTVPIIAVTANAFTHDLKECRENGMNDCITKPLDPSKLIQIIGQHLER